MTQALAGMGEGVKRLVYVTAVAPRKGGSQVGSLGMAGVLVEEAVVSFVLLLFGFFWCV